MLDNPRKSSDCCAWLPASPRTTLGERLGVGTPMRPDANPYYRLAIMANNPRRLRLISRPFTDLMDARAEAVRIRQSMLLSAADIVLQRNAYGDYWQEFLIEEDLDPFEGRLKYQEFDTATPDQLESYGIIPTR